MTNLDKMAMLSLEEAANEMYATRPEYQKLVDNLTFSTLDTTGCMSADEHFRQCKIAIYLDKLMPIGILEKMDFHRSGYDI